MVVSRSLSLFAHVIIRLAPLAFGEALATEYLHSSTGNLSSLRRQGSSNLQTLRFSSHATRRTGSRSCCGRNKPGRQIMEVRMCLIPQSMPMRFLVHALCTEVQRLGSHGHAMGWRRLETKKQKTRLPSESGFCLICFNSDLTRQRGPVRIATTGR